jgi:hypothetical protein
MRFLVLLTFGFLFASCEKPLDCISSTGALVSENISITSFKKIVVHNGIELILKQGTEYSCEVKTGQNLIDNIDIQQEGQTLILKDKSTCNWVREYGQTKVFITAPNIEEIHSYTEKDISSDGVLTYPVLKLYSLDTGGDVGTNDFHIQIDNNQLFIESNSFVRYYISGKTNHAFLNFYEGNGRIEAPNLIAKKIGIYHRGSNDMIVNPTESIDGKLLNVGNLILKNTPPIMTVQALFQGQVIYNLFFLAVFSLKICSKFLFF